MNEVNNIHLSDYTNLLASKDTVSLEENLVQHKTIKI